MNSRTFSAMNTCMSGHYTSTKTHHAQGPGYSGTPVGRSGRSRSFLSAQVQRARELGLCFLGSLSRKLRTARPEPNIFLQKCGKRVRSSIGVHDDQLTLMTNLSMRRADGEQDNVPGGIRSGLVRAFVREGSSHGVLLEFSGRCNFT
jgi:hypothetical protein